MAVSLPYDVIKAIEEAIPRREQAEKVVRAIEQSLCAIRKEAQEREAVIKVQVGEAVKEGLKDELASKEDLALLRAEFREEIGCVREEIAQIKEALNHTATKEELEALRSEMREVRLLLKVVIGIILAGFTIFNPGFIQTIKTIIGLFG